MCRINCSGGCPGCDPEEHRARCVQRYLNKESNTCTCHQETACCSHTSISEMARQLTEKPAPNVGAASTATPLSPLATEMERCYGFVTEILVVSEEVLGLAVEDYYHARRLLPLEGRSEDGFLGKLLQSHKKSKMICRLAIELQKSLQLVEDLAGTQNQTGSSCQCAEHKGKSLG